MENLNINTTEDLDAPQQYEVERRSKLRSFLGQAAMKAMELGVVGSVMYTGQKVFTETILPQGEISLPVIAGTAASIVASHHFYNKNNISKINPSLE